MPKERDIQRAILLALSEAFHPHGIFWTADTGVARSMDGERILRFGLPGQPDIQGCLLGRWIGIEVKTATGKQREAQKRFQAAIVAAGGTCVLARSPEEATTALAAALNLTAPDHPNSKPATADVGARAPQRPNALRTASSGVAALMLATFPPLRRARTEKPVSDFFRTGSASHFPGVINLTRLGCLSEPWGGGRDRIK